MAKKQLRNMAISAFCTNMAMMLAAGINPEEACSLLGEDAKENDFHDAARAMEGLLVSGTGLGEAFEGCGFFPSYVAKMVASGEQAGRTEEVLKSLAGFYESKARLEKRIRSAVVYPMILLLLMAAILLVLLSKVIPVFEGVYESFGSVGDVYVKFAYGIGWVVFGVTALLAVVLMAGLVASGNPKGVAVLDGILQRLPGTKRASEKMAVSSFCSMLSIFVASGMDQDQAMEAAMGTITNAKVLEKIAKAKGDMEKGASLATAVFDNKVFEPLYARMLLSGSRSGNLEGVLNHLAQVFAEDQDEEMDRLIDSIEPALSAFLTVAVGITLVSAMLPLVGILGAMS